MWFYNIHIKKHRLQSLFLLPDNTYHQLPILRSMAAASARLQVLQNSSLKLILFSTSDCKEFMYVALAVLRTAIWFCAVYLCPRRTLSIQLSTFHYRSARQ